MRIQSRSSRREEEGAAAFVVVIVAVGDSVNGEPEVYKIVRETTIFPTIQIETLASAGFLAY